MLICDSNSNSTLQDVPKVRHKICSGGLRIWHFFNVGSIGDNRWQTTLLCKKIFILGHTLYGNLYMFVQMYYVSQIHHERYTSSTEFVFSTPFLMLIIILFENLHIFLSFFSSLSTFKRKTRAEDPTCGCDFFSTCSDFYVEHYTQTKKQKNCLTFY